MREGPGKKEIQGKKYFSNVSIKRKAVLYIVEKCSAPALKRPTDGDDYQKSIKTRQEQT